MSDNNETLNPVSRPHYDRSQRNLFFGLAVQGAAFIAILILIGFVIIPHLQWGSKSNTVDTQNLAAKDNQISSLQSQISALKSQGLTATSSGLGSPAPMTEANSAGLDRLEHRLDALEARQQILIDGLSAAHAAARLEQAAKDNQPFAEELSALEGHVSDTQGLTALRPLAAKGVPSVTQLALEFPAYAAKANEEAKQSDGKKDVFSYIRHALASVISVRRINNESGVGTEAQLEKAEHALDNGDIATALSLISTLSPSALKALKPWTDEAKNRLFVNQVTADIMLNALNKLQSPQVPASAGSTNGGK